jgi:hypothetical protein
VLETSPEGCAGVRVQNLAGVVPDDGILDCVRLEVRQITDTRSVSTAPARGDRDHEVAPYLRAMRAACQNFLMIVWRYVRSRPSTATVGTHRATANNPTCTGPPAFSNTITGNGLGSYTSSPFMVSTAVTLILGRDIQW